jgi:hypothetical protein
MADEAFALSPISARAAQPSEEDYEAISQAFMETSRGRWFLGEYAKRNRNADTSMVLDAVARIEETLAVQRQPAPESGLAEALAAIGNAVDEARAASTAAVESLAVAEHLAPIRRGVRVIQEISWRWREIGADSRICDLIDSQASAIEGACGEISLTSPQAALSAAFDLIKARIAELDDSDMASPEAMEAAVPSPSPAARDEMPAVAETAVQETSPADSAEAAMSAPLTAAEAAPATLKAADVTVEIVDITVEAAAETLDVTVEVTDENAGADDTYDEALLDMVALEMAALDPADIDVFPDITITADEIHAAEVPTVEPITSPPAEPIIVREKPEPMAAPAAIRASLQCSLESSRESSREISLGSTLIANGIVRKPVTSESDPLAPIRRMSQAEKIAFFS